MPEEETTTQQELSEPLLAQGEALENGTDAGSENASFSCPNEGDSGSNNDNDSGFSYKAELIEMANLGLPLAVSFFCRMVRTNKCSLEKIL
jgi:hypothetical protein